MMRLFFFLFFFSLAPLSAQGVNVKVNAQSAILYNPDTGAIVFQKRAKEPHYPASILKIATALFVLEQTLDLQRECVASNEALAVVPADEKQSDPLSYPPYVLEHDAVTIGIKEGQGYSVWALLHGLLLESGNDAANVLAEGIGGSIPHFMEELNRYLQQRGILQTRFQNPHGLRHPAQMTTAYDMALIAGLAFKNSIFCQITKTPTYVFHEGKTLVNISRLLKEGKYQYAKYIGGKTGYIASAGYNFVAAAEDKGRKLIVVLLGCETTKDRFEDAINLFEAAFQEKEERRLLFAKDHECFRRVMPKTGKVLKAGLHEDVAIHYFPSEEPDLSANLLWHKLKGRYTVGDLVGRLVVENGSGIEVASAPLYAACTSERKHSVHWGLWLLGFLILATVLTFYKKAGKVLKR